MNDDRYLTHTFVILDKDRYIVLPSVDIIRMYIEKEKDGVSIIYHVAGIDEPEVYKENIKFSSKLPKKMREKFIKDLVINLSLFRVLTFVGGESTVHSKIFMTEKFVDYWNDLLRKKYGQNRKYIYLGDKSEE
jgi:hypothetical protein